MAETTGEPMLKIHQYEVGYCTHPGCVALKGASFKSCKFQQEHG